MNEQAPRNEPVHDVDPISDETKEKMEMGGTVGAGLLGCAAVGLMPWIVIAAAAAFLLILGMIFSMWPSGGGQ